MGQVSTKKPCSTCFGDDLTCVDCHGKGWVERRKKRSSQMAEEIWKCQSCAARLLECPMGTVGICKRCGGPCENFYDEWDKGWVSDVEVIISEDHPPQVDYAGGLAASTKIPHFHLIPTVALEALAERFEKGIERKGDKAWNAISSNQQILTNREFAIERISHIIHHCMKLRDKLTADDNPFADGDDDDAGAIVWGGAFLCSVRQAMKEKNEQQQSGS